MLTPTMWKIFTFISSLLFCFSALYVNAQKPKILPEKDNTPFFNGLTFQVDAASVVTSAISTGVTYSYEAGAQVDLKHKYFPVFELGYAGANKTTDGNINFKTNGSFDRIGVDINLLRPKKGQKPTNNLFLVGVRLGMTNFRYNINNISITDDYWLENQILNYSDIPATKIWYEIVAGIHVEVAKNIYMGWIVRNKNLLTQDVTGNPAPWYIPGFGINNGTNWGFNYTIGYKIQIPVKHKKAVFVPKPQKK
jgi:hypothetical protein